jgi:pSer/pThr/pTyr-binding forkhead associated (FHA) protein
VNLDKNLASNIEREFGKGLRLTDEQLRTVEKGTGLQRGILGYDSTDKLSMRLGRDSVPDYIKNGAYVDESRAGSPPNATDRPALYQLYDRYHLDPVEQLSGAAKPAPLLKPKLAEQASINGQKYNPDQIVIVGRGKDADIKVGAGADGVVSRKHALIHTDASGKTYIADLGSTNGTFINGKRIEPSADPKQPKWYRVASGDRVTLGTEYDLKLRPPGEISAAQKPPVTAALRQSNEFASKDQTSAPLEDGFQNAGQRNRINADGSFDKAVGVATVIDRGNDPILQQTMKDAESRFAGVNPPRERARQLAEFVRELLTPAGDSGGQLDKWYANFSKEHSGERALLGEFISSHRGGCTQQAMLYKVLADDLFKDVPGVTISLVRGSTAADGVVDHAWVNVDFGNGPRIYDPRENITGQPTAELPHYRIGGPKAEAQPLEPGAKIPWRGNNWVVEGFDRATGNVVVSHYGEKVISLGDLMRDRQNVDKLLRHGSRPHTGDSYRVTRSNGAIEQWKVVSYDATTGKVRLSSDRAFTDEIPSGQLAALRRAG